MGTIIATSLGASMFRKAEAITVSSDAWFAKHGSRPSGEGEWWFSPGGGIHANTFRRHVGQYKDAVAEAKAWAKERGFTIVYLVP